MRGSRTVGSASAGDGSSTSSESPTTVASSEGPIPTVMLETVGGSTSSETFSPTTYVQYQTLKSTLTTSIVGPAGVTFPAIIGPGGIGWKLPTISPGDPIPNLPAHPPDPGNDANNPPNSDPRHSRKPTTNQPTSNQPSTTQHSAQSTARSSPTSCTNSETASDCSVICRTAATAANTVSAPRTCSTTCYSTFQVCTATDRIATSTASDSASSVENTLATPAIYSEVSNTIPYAAVSAVVMGEFLSNSITDGVGAAPISSAAGTRDLSRSRSSQAASPSAISSQAPSPSQSINNGAAPSTSASLSSAAPTTEDATPTRLTSSATVSSLLTYTTSPPTFSCVPM
ncbi:MAG: hypothetical protein Q9191_005129 [Dirinaria sp. TL-2023a]